MSSSASPKFDTRRNGGMKYRHCEVALGDRGNLITHHDSVSSYKSFHEEFSASTN